jgi:radial spoke head protein 4A
LADSKVWQWAGVGFGEYDTMCLQKSLKQLVAKTGATSIRFWGKIKGTEKDYYVAEGTLDAGEPAEDAEPVTETVEARGQGVNKFVYWVTNSPLEQWTQLPDLKPSNIVSARRIKHTFSGNINR